MRAQLSVVMCFVELLFCMMAPAKFGLFKSKSKEHDTLPSTEHLLQSSNSIDRASSPLPSTSAMTPEELALTRMAAQMQLDDSTIQRHPTPTRRVSDGGRLESTPTTNHKNLKTQVSTERSFTSSLNQEDLDQIMPYEDLVDEESTRPIDQMDQLGYIDDDGASTSYDVNSIQFDEISIAPSEDPSVYCGSSKKAKKRLKAEEQSLRDSIMWHASNYEVMHNLLNKTGSFDDQIKWQAIASSRGLCSLTDCCMCNDCRHTKFLNAGMTDGDGGLGAAPFINAAGLGCNLQ